MKTILTFVYHWKEEDGIGASCDAFHAATSSLFSQLEEADSMDDVAAIFSEIKHVV